MNVTTKTKRPYKARSKPIAMDGFIVLLQHDGHCKALGASATVINTLSEQLQPTLPTLCGVWLLAEEATKAMRGLPEELKGMAQVMAVTVTLKAVP